MRPLNWRPPVAAVRGEVEPFWPDPLPNGQGAAGVMESLVPFFWPIMFGGICASVIGLRIHMVDHSPSSLVAVLIGCLGYLLAGVACRRAGLFLAGEGNMGRRAARLYDVGVVLVAAGAGSLVLTTLASGLSGRLELLALMVAMAILGVAHAVAARRPWAGAMQVVAIVIPTVAGLLLYWKDWIGAAAALGLVIYGGLIIVMSWSMYLRQVEIAETREVLGAERARLAVAVANMPYALVVVDNGFWPITWNRRCLDLLGLAEMPEGRSILTIMAESPALGLDTVEARAALVTRTHRMTRAGKPFDSVLRLADGRVLDIEAQPTGDGGWVVVLRDTTGEWEALAELNREARRCPLTGLPNRRAFMEALEGRVAAGRPFALLLVDLDSFKKINERYGHSVGDRVLQAIGMRLRTAAEDLFVARLGGDEFAVLVDADEAGALALAAVLGVQSETPLRFEDLSIAFGFAIGIACHPRDGAGVAGLMRAADLALLSAKLRAAPGTVVFQPQLEVEAEARNSAELRVREAVRRGAIDVAYQPIVDLAAGRVCGVEALARWRDDGRGPIPTDALVAIAEQRALIADLRRIVLGEATGVLRGLDPALGLWFNVSMLDLVTPGFVTELTDSFAAAGIAPGRVVVELTETALMTHEGISLDALTALRDMGTRVALDDFGAGFSSLERLRRLPIDEIKLSGGLIAGATADAAAASIFSAAARLGRTINLAIIAEGVESAADLRLARAAGIERAQGFLFAPPVAAEHLPAEIDRLNERLPMLLSEPLAGLAGPDVGAADAA